MPLITQPTRVYVSIRSHSGRKKRHVNKWYQNSLLAERIQLGFAIPFIPWVNNGKLF
jgi:hypothetical protein